MRNNEQQCFLPAVPTLHAYSDTALYILSVCCLPTCCMMWALRHLSPSVSYCAHCAWAPSWMHLHCVKLFDDTRRSVSTARSRMRMGVRRDAYPAQVGTPLCRGRLTQNTYTRAVRLDLFVIRPRFTRTPYLATMPWCHALPVFSSPFPALPSPAIHANSACHGTYRHWPSLLTLRRHHSFHK